MARLLDGWMMIGLAGWMVRCLCWLVCKCTNLKNGMYGWFSPEVVESSSFPYHQLSVDRVSTPNLHKIINWKYLTVEIYWVVKYSSPKFTYECWYHWIVGFSRHITQNSDERIQIEGKKNCLTDLRWSPSLDQPITPKKIIHHICKYRTYIST